MAYKIRSRSVYLFNLFSLNTITLVIIALYYIIIKYKFKIQRVRR